MTSNFLFTYVPPAVEESPCQSFERSKERFQFQPAWSWSRGPPPKYKLDCCRWNSTGQATKGGTTMRTKFLS